LSIRPENGQNKRLEATPDERHSCNRTSLARRASAESFGDMSRFSFALLVAACLTSCGCNKPYPDIAEWRQSVQASVDPTALQRWATNCIAKGVITKDDAGQEIGQLMRGPNIQIETDAVSGQKAVVFMYGGGFGHWAIVVGAADYQCRMGNIRSYWTNGIWFAWE
jgi:hypothetical protein